jgi:hypothetical protein
VGGAHKHPPIGFRPPADSDDREWLLGYSDRTGRPVNAILTDALRLFRAQQDGAAPSGTVPALRNPQRPAPAPAKFKSARSHAQTCKCGTCHPPKEGKR